MILGRRISWTLVASFAMLIGISSPGFSQNVTSGSIGGTALDHGRR